MAGKTKRRTPAAQAPRVSRIGRWMPAAGGLLLLASLLYAFDAASLFRGRDESDAPKAAPQRILPRDPRLQRAYLIRDLYVRQYAPGWEAANGAIGDAWLYAATRDTMLLRYHTVERDLLDLFDGTWVDDRAWNALAELAWWHVTGRTNRLLVESAKNRYVSARTEGRLSKHEGFWSWYNWPPDARVNDQIFTNSNMNHMVSVACGLYEATGERHFLEDALKVWNGEGKVKGIEKIFYRGNGLWKGKGGLAAFGKQLPWEGTEYCSVAAALYRVTRDPKYKRIAVATARRIMDPANGWVDSTDFYQLRMDGNGAFVHYLFDAYELAPDELADLPGKVERMLEHVWTNHRGKATVTLHRDSDHAIRNGWNPNGGEDGYGVDAVGSLHAQTQALRAFSVFAYYRTHRSFWGTAAQ